MKILITGGRGQLGHDCTKVLRAQNEVFSPGSAQLDITDARAVDEALKHFRPEVVINCAAFTRVDDCETEREQAWRVNVQGPENLAQGCARIKARLVHISTDYVFDGKKGVLEAYVESDATGPLSYYGQTKLEAETRVRSAAAEHAIVRTAWLYGRHGQNFLKSILKAALADPTKTIRVVNDKHGSPTWSYTLARQIEKLIFTGVHGTFHATAEGFCTWYALASRFLDRMGLPVRVTPCTSEEFPRPAPRPANSILENRRLKEEGINCMISWQTDLDRFTARYKDELFRESIKEI